MLIVEQEAAEGDAEKLIEESVQLTGAHIDCSGTTVSISRNSDIVLRMRHDSEKIAGLWATKMAVACGNAESISKLFSIQRRRIQTLEQNSQEAQLNNEQIERCLNFLSREYVDMRYHVSRAPSRTGSTAQLEEAAKEPTKAFEVEEVDLEDLVQIPHNPQSRHQSEPEKEPLDSARGFRPEHAWEPEKLVPDSELTAKSTEKDLYTSSRAAPGHELAKQSHTGPCLLGNFANSPKHPQVKPPGSRNSMTAKDKKGTLADEPLVPSPRRERRRVEAAKEPPAPSPKDRSPPAHEIGRSSVDALVALDRRGHKLAMAHQRVLGRQSNSQQQSRKSVRSHGSSASSTSLR